MADPVEDIVLGIVLVLIFIVAILAIRRFIKGRKNKNPNTHGMGQNRIYPTNYSNPNIEQQNPMPVQQNPSLPSFLTWEQLITSLKENMDKTIIRVDELEKHYDLLLKSAIPIARKRARKVFEDFKKEDKKVQVGKIKEEKKKFKKIAKKLRKRN